MNNKIEGIWHVNSPKEGIFGIQIPEDNRMLNHFIDECSQDKDLDGWLKVAQALANPEHATSNFQIIEHRIVLR